MNDTATNIPNIIIMHVYKIRPKNQNMLLRDFVIYGGNN